MAEERRLKYPLHYYVLKNDVEALENELRRITTEEAARHAAVSSVSTSSSSSSSLAVPPERAAFVPTGINQRDDRGNTAFHLAIHLMRHDMVELFLRYNVDFGVKNGGGWNGLQEAVASGHRDMLDRLMSATQTHIENKLESRLPKALEALAQVPDFRLKMRWEVGTWVPLVSRFCPWDEYEIYKCGSSVRVDTTLIGFDKMQWVRGHVSFLVLPLESEKPGDIILMNHDHKMAEYLFDSFRRQTKERGTATEMLMAPLVRGHVDTESVKFQHIQPSGSWFRSRPKTETIGSWGNCKQYEAENIRIISKKRTDSRVNRNAMRPHPSDAEIEAIRNNFCSPRAIKEYFEGNDLPLPPGKKGEGLLYSYEKQQVKVRTQTAKIWFSADFPFSLRQLIPIFEVLAPTGKHFEKLYKFITMQLPDEGFPVKMEIPLFPTITATITFGEMKLETSDPSLFVLPKEYEVLHNASMLFRTNFNDAQAPGDNPDATYDPHSSSSSSSSSAPPPDHHDHHHYSENVSDDLDEELSNDHVS